MSGRKRGELPGELQRAQEKFQSWRDRRRSGERIPGPLWKLAVKLAKMHGICRTATALKLDYYSLKKQVERSVGTSSPTAAFVELSSPVSFPGASEYTIEFQDVGGASMRVHVKGADIPDMIALGRSFWNAD